MLSPLLLVNTYRFLLISPRVLFVLEIYVIDVGFSFEISL